ncbi:hypothetical protein FHI69_04455 [Janthinobacterium lividum]|uniref:Uncharacterized protein n=1 Tax=Janthinobacterium lividum TaxID=29581 RepID=A0A5C4NUE1_9BURK|nr:hypothetical protein [Janthinobacterium lividum]TNC78541.1 hypothetical protein FHI69_04455 [Janthinobacterium lividum]
MGDFFYYGQKDTIQRLNELAGRGAVVASYVPAVGRSPLAGPSGYMHPAWIDPNIPIQMNARLCSGPTAKYGYSYLAQGAPTPKWFLIATLREENLGGHDNLLIKGILNENWGAVSTTPVTILIGVRGGFYVDWHMEGARISQSRFIVYKRADGKYDVYAYFQAGCYSSLSFDLAGMDAATLQAPIETTSQPEGVIVFDTAQVPGSPSYIAPRWQAMTGNEGMNRGILFTDIIGVGAAATIDYGNSFLARGQTKQNQTDEQEGLRLGFGGIPGFAYPGQFGFMVGGGYGSVNKEGYKLTLRAWDNNSNSWTGNLLAAYGNGRVYMPLLKAGSTDTSILRHNISRYASMGAEILYIGREGFAAPCVGVNASDGTGGWAASPAVLYVGKNSNTARGANIAGTVNTMGNDYAEYVHKYAGCSDIAPGQVIGIADSNEITDQWDSAILFAIKSTAPSFVGGDTWALTVGARPEPMAGAEPSKPQRRTDVTTQQSVAGTQPVQYVDVVTQSGDTDSEWAAKQEEYAAAMATYRMATKQDAEAMAAFDAALEAERQKVDRIAIAGRVPVNVLDAKPGDYIVPVQDGTGIKGIPVREDDLTMKQYLHAVGRVISIEPDGRAYVMVKAV